MNEAIRAVLSLDFPLIALDGRGTVIGLSTAAETLLGLPQGLDGAALAALLEIPPEEGPPWLERARRGCSARLRLPNGLLSPQLLIRAAPLSGAGEEKPAWVLGLHRRESAVRQRFEREILLRIASVPISELMWETVALTTAEPQRCPITSDLLQMIMSYVGGRCALMLRDKELPRMMIIGQAGLDVACVRKLLDYLERDRNADLLARGVVGEGARSGLVFSVPGFDPRHPALAEIERCLPFPCQEAWVDGIGGFGAALTFFDSPADAELRPFATEAYVRLGRQLESAGYSRNLYSAYQDLQQAQERIIQAGRLAALGEIAAGIAHELRQPVTAINNFISNIFSQLENQRFDRLREKAQEYRERSRRNVERLMGIIDHLRAFSRDDSVQFIPTDLRRLMDEFRETFFHQGRLLSREIRVEWRFPAELPIVEIDPQRIEQVILNLVSNATDALEGRAEPRIVVGVESQEARVRLYVEDNGPGIPAELRKRIFDPFFTTKPAGKGTGIGLSISYGIVKGHNGEILVENNESGGATFSVILPVRQPGPAGSARPGQASGLESGPRPGRGT
jgi:signal transduction histidine kinase